VKRLAALLAGVLACAGCDINVTHWDLPGGTATGAGYTIGAVFRDVGNLTVRGQVRSRGIAVGDVTGISLLPDSTALVSMKLKKDVQVPVGTHAVLSTASLLGAPFVDLVPPTGAPTGFLQAGDRIAEAATSSVPEVEQVLAAMSAVLNGSGLAQLDSVVSELGTALAPRPDTVRDLVAQLRSLVGTLDAHKGSLVSLVDSLHRLSAQLAENTDALDAALTDLAPGLAALSETTDGFTALLTKLSHLGTTAERVIGKVRADTVTDLELLRPLWEAMASVRSDFVRTVDLLPVAAADLRRSIPGDFVSLSVTLTGGSPVAP
jgi:phospholipid/cholesterol/gamma-HCH transport system substrate-binding protein